MSSPETRAPDPRPARTKAAIFTAARELGASEGEVTVHSLTKRAGVSRAAFYSHFSGLDDLLGDIVEAMFVFQLEQGRRLVEQGRTTHELIQVFAVTLVAYVVEHHAFLRGALEWKFSHTTYLKLVGNFADMHERAITMLGDAVPEGIPVKGTARFFAGGSIDLIVQALVDSEAIARAGGTPDAGEIAERLLRTYPSWYSGLGPADPIPMEMVSFDLLRDAQEQPFPTEP